MMHSSIFITEPILIGLLRIAPPRRSPYCVSPYGSVVFHQ